MWLTLFSVLAAATPEQPEEPAVTKAPEVVEAAPASPVPATTTMYVVDEKVATAALEASVDEAAAQFNFIIRSIARNKLRGAATYCKELEFAISEAVFNVRCVERSDTAFQIALDGTKTNWTTDEGKTFEVTGSRSGNMVNITYVGANGGRVNDYEFSDGAMTLSSAVNGDQLTDPMSWTLSYTAK